MERGLPHLHKLSFLIRQNCVILCLRTEQVISMRSWHKILSVVFFLFSEDMPLFHVHLTGSSVSPFTSFPYYKSITLFMGAQAHAGQTDQSQITTSSVSSTAQAVVHQPVSSFFLLVVVFGSLRHVSRIRVLRSPYRSLLCSPRQVSVPFSTAYKPGH